VSDEGENIRFVVTNLETPRNQWIYETIYCGRGQMENYIKDHKLFLHADRTSCHQFEANQFRVFLHSAAYVLMHALRSQGLRGTAWGKAQCNQIQIRLLKVGARVEELKTKVKFHFPSSFPLKELYETMLSNLSRAELCRSPESICTWFDRYRLIDGHGPKGGHGCVHWCVRMSLGKPSRHGIGSHKVNQTRKTLVVDLMADVHPRFLG
jgi:hypothetical protein